VRDGKGRHKMTAFNLISFIATIASLIVAIGAIWLSVVFYKMSVAASTATTEAAKGIASSVERLEKLFDKLYSDTFSMMRDTVSDMRKHMWPTEDSEGEKAAEVAEQKADEKFDQLRKAMEVQLSEVLHQQRLSEDKFAALQHEMINLIENAMTRSRQAESEAREEAIRELILRELRVIRRIRPMVSVTDIIDRLRDRFPARRIVLELERMRTEGLLAMNSDQVRPDTEVRLRPSMETS
jgi:hypothetical protein